jgi:hypothetical protein
VACSASSSRPAIRSMTRFDASSRPSSSLSTANRSVSRARAVARAAAARSAAASSRWSPAALVFLAAAAGTRIIEPDLGHGPAGVFPCLYTNLLTGATLCDSLLAIDQELAAATAQAGDCRRCAGRLDHADAGP